jgi:hypothetical protein
VHLKDNLGSAGLATQALNCWPLPLTTPLPPLLLYIVFCCRRSFEALILQAGWFPDAQLAVATMGLCSVTNAVV